MRLVSPATRELTGVAYNHIAATASGFSWACLGGPSQCEQASTYQDNATATKYGITAVYEIANAAVMSTATTTVVTAVVPSGDHCVVCTLEFSLYEFAGVGAYLSPRRETKPAHPRTRRKLMPVLPRRVLCFSR